MTEHCCKQSCFFVSRGFQSAVSSACAARTRQAFPFLLSILLHTFHQHSFSALSSSWNSSGEFYKVLGNNTNNLDLLRINMATRGWQMVLASLNKQRCQDEDSTNLRVTPSTLTSTCDEGKNKVKYLFIE